MKERILEYDTHNVELQSWEEFASVLEALIESGPRLRMIFKDSDSQVDNKIFVELVENWGFNVNLRQERCTLIDPYLGSESVEYLNDGIPYRSPRYCFVEKSLMLLAAQCFFETGKSSPLLQWIDTNDSFTPLQRSY